MKKRKLISLMLTAGMLLGTINLTAEAEGIASLDDIALESSYSAAFAVPVTTTGGDAISWSSSNTDAVITSGETAYVLSGLEAKTTKLTATLNGESKTFSISIPAFEYTGETLFAEDFEGEEALNSDIWQLDSTAMPNTSDQTGANYMGVAGVDDTNHVYMIKRTDNTTDGAKKSYIHINTTDLPANSRIIYDVDVNTVQQPKNAKAAAAFMNYWLCRDAANTIGKYSGFATGYLGAAKGISIKGTSGSYSTTVASAVDKWHNIKFDVTSADGLFDAYVDDKKVADDYEMRAKGAPLKHLAVGFDGNTTGEVWMDNIKYYVCPKEASEVLATTTLGVDDADNVTSDVSVPTVDGVTWVSSNPDIITSAGKVDRTKVDGLSQDVTLYGVYSESGMVSAKAYPLTVIASAAEEMDESEVLNALVLPASISDSYELVTNSNDYIIEWTSSNHHSIKIVGGEAVAVPSNLPSKSTLTATINTEAGPLTRSFVVSVPPVGSDTAYVNEDFESVNVGELPDTQIGTGDMWRRRNETDTFGVSAESDTNANKVLRLNAAECVLLNFDGIVNAHHKTHYLTFSTKTEGNPIANLRFLDVQDSNPASGHQVFNLLEGLYRNKNIFMLQAATSDSFVIDNNTWYDVAIKFNYDNSLVEFYAKKSTDDEYTLMKSNSLKYLAVPKKIAIWFDSGDGSHVYDNFMFYSSDFVPTVEHTYSLVDSGSIKKDDARQGMYYQVSVSDVDEELSLGIGEKKFTITDLGSFDITTTLTYVLIGGKAATEDISSDITLTSGETEYSIE